LLLDKNEEISNINKQKDKFFSIIAHDLRGPFTGFLGLTELLAEDIDEMDKDEIQFAAVNMRTSATNLNRLLDNLLEWSRMEQGLIPFSPKENNLDEVVNDCVAPLLVTAAKKEITIETSITQNLKIFADQNILQSVIRNFLSNAVKFTPRNGSVKIDARQDSNNTVISIADNGIGMSAKMIENIFKIDLKTNRIGTEDEPSTGLGLILCKEFVEKHNGKIWIESEVNQGSTFHFSLPHAIV
jgi:signal transduction histidine kinase